ncbi:MAG TPA: hypothetical protein ENK57_09190, partial [Polyangiaceae bacterium]|nr:hypothetical protein [Polyangiaceae bacterium]
MKSKMINDGKQVREIADRFADDLQVELAARWEAWQLDLSRKELHEVVGALLARQVTLAVEFAQVPACWNYHVGPLFLRAMADVYITLAWIFNEPTERLERAQKFIHFGLGQEKLQLEHRHAEIKRKGRELSTEERLHSESVKAWIDAQQYSFLTEVNVGSWSDLTIRKMAEEAGCIDFYNYVYQPWSGVAHSQWQHVGRYNVEHCAYPLPLNHLVPAAPMLYSDLHLLYRAGKYAEKALRLFDEKA